MSKNTRERISSLCLILSLSIGCDQTTKRIAEQVLSENSYSFFFDTIRLQFMKNSGAFLGFGSHFPEWVKFWIFLIMPVLVLSASLIFLIVTKKIEPMQRIMIALMVSGGFGNLIDRFVFSGQVTDFINLGIGPVRTGIFNIADLALMTGASVLVVSELYTSRKNIGHDQIS